MSNHVFIYAGCKREAEKYIDDNQMYNFATYLSAIPQIRGIKNATIIKIGTWWRRDDTYALDCEIEIGHHNVIADTL